MSKLAIPPDYPMPECFFLTFDFSPGTKPEDQVTLTRVSDRERIPVVISECADPPTLEQLNAHFPKKES
jgi:hypothetical protein